MKENKFPQIKGTPCFPRVDKEELLELWQVVITPKIQGEEKRCRLLPEASARGQTHLYREVEKPGFF